MAGWTPTTSEIKAEYVIGALRTNSAFPVAQYAGEFDRWLSAQRAAVWDECLDAIDENEINTTQAREGNPYRALVNGEGI